MEKKTVITICTISCNRGYMLPHVYDSLRRQTRQRFEWLIMDTEGGARTGLLVRQWMAGDSPFPIRCIPCEEYTRTGALQRAIDLAVGDYFCLVDPEEILMEEAVDCFLRWIPGIEKEEMLIGASGGKCYLDGTPLQETEPHIGIKGYVDAGYLERHRYGLDNQQCELFKTSILRRYPLVQCQGEEDTPLQITLDEIAMEGYKMRWYREPVCRGEYLWGSRTAYEKRQERRNPMGYAMLYNHKLRYRHQSFYRRFDAASRHIALSLCAHHPEYILKSYDRKMSALALIPGLFMAFCLKQSFS